jgi:hypothetical protein
MKKRQEIEGAVNAAKFEGQVYGNSERGYQHLLTYMASD